MSVAQEKNKANFKKAIAYRKKTGCTLKEAFAHVKSSPVTKNVVVKKKVGATKIIEKHETKKTKPTKTVMVKRDKKGHFKKFKTVGSIKQTAFSNFETVAKNLERQEKFLLGLIQLKNNAKDLVSKKIYLNDISYLQKYIKELKEHKTQLKKLL
jgi:hypothetical protein